MTTIYEKEQAIIKAKNTYEELHHYIEQAAGREEIEKAERRILEFALKIGLHSVQAFVDKSGSGYEKGNPPLDCQGKAMKNKVTKESTYKSIFGTVLIKRTGYHDTIKGRYFFPINSQLNLPESTYSYVLNDWLLETTCETDHREAVRLLNKIFKLDLDHSVSERLSEKVAADVDSFYEELPAPSAETEGSHIAASADGKGIRMVKSEREGEAYKPKTPKARLAKGEKPGRKKESIVTVDYSFHPAPRTAEEIVQALMKEYQCQNEPDKTADIPLPAPRSPLNKLQRATLAGKDAAMDDLMVRIKRRDPEGKKPVIFLIDGDRALEKALERAVGRHDMQERLYIIILDIIHVTEYIWEAGTAIYGERSHERYPWVREKILDILEGKVGYVIGAIKQTRDKKKLSKTKINTLNKAITYLDNHKHMMMYDQYLAEGYPIGTGVVESACGSLVKNRMEKSGMRWKREGAQNILDLRAVKLNGHWHDYMEKYVNTQRARLYADDYKYRHKKAA